jgi:hypothetical protein
MLKCLALYNPILKHSNEFNLKIWKQTANSPRIHLIFKETEREKNTISFFTNRNIKEGEKKQT